MDHQKMKRRSRIRRTTPHQEKQRQMNYAKEIKRSMRVLTFTHCQIMQKMTQKKMKKLKRQEEKKKMMEQKKKQTKMMRNEE